MPTVCLVRPSGYPHAEALAELEETVRYGLVRSGLWGPAPPRIVLGAHLPGYQPEVGDIIYNTEHPSSPWWSAEYVENFKGHEVWSYFPGHVGKYVPIGYVPELTRIDKADPQDIDVLFYGSMNERRAKVVHDLEAAGLNVVTVFGCYGAERDALIARSKVVLNMHYYTPGAFEAVRVSYLWANRKCVVCEESTDYPTGCPYDRLVQDCISLVSPPPCRLAALYPVPVIRAQIERLALERFSATSEADILDEALK